VNSRSGVSRIYRNRFAIVGVAVVLTAVFTLADEAGTTTTDTLHPQITSVSPNPFSPNHDGHDDVTAFRVHLPSVEHVSFIVQNPNKQTIQGPHSPHGVISRGDHTYHWDGKNNHGKVAGNGKYTIRVTTSAKSGTSTLHGSATAPVTVHNAAPKPPPPLQPTCAVITDANGNPEPCTGGCTPGYTPCIPPGPDVDCADGSGNGPRYVQGPITVTGPDIYGLDRDGNGVGCQ
jgi:FlgD Ig-like domain